jgi:hypothetical protein
MIGACVQWSGNAQIIKRMQFGIGRVGESGSTPSSGFDDEIPRGVVS